MRPSSGQNGFRRLVRVVSRTPARMIAVSRSSGIALSERDGTARSGGPGGASECPSDPPGRRRPVRLAEGVVDRVTRRVNARPATAPPRRPASSTHPPPGTAGVRPEIASSGAGSPRRSRRPRRRGWVPRGTWNAPLPPLVLHSPVRRDHEGHARPPPDPDVLPPVLGHANAAARDEQHAQRGEHRRRDPCHGEILRLILGGRSRDRLPEHNPAPGLTRTPGGCYITLVPAHARPGP